MKLIIRTLIVAWLAVSPLLPGAQPAATPPPTEKKIYKEINGAKLEIWIWKPSGWRANDRRSAIVFYHGGGWRMGSPTAFARQSKKLAERGMVAFSVQYRLTSQPGISIVDCVKDARSAFRWVRSHAAELGIDPEKIAAGGGSAGGHLAATLVTLDTLNDPKDDLKISTQPTALMLFNPALRLSSEREKEAIAKGAPVRINVSPFDHVKRGHPPTIIFHGEDDTTVPIQSARDYAAKVEKVGGHCTVVGFPGEKHGFFNRDPLVWETLKQGETFLEKQGLLK